MAITSANQLELLQTAEAVAREKNIDPMLVIEAMEESLARAAKSRYGSEMDIRVSIDRKTGRATFTRVRTVVEEELLENYQAEFTVEQAKQYMDNPEVGDVFSEEVPPVELGRIAAQSAKQVILQKVREAERDKQYEEFKDKAGKNAENASLGLFGYPALMAADILLYHTTHVPVGEDQKQHLELTRDIAIKFNNDFGVDFFPVTEPVIEGAATRVMSLRDGTKKMSKSDPSDMSRINLTDDADAIAKKIRKAKTDPEPLPSEFAGLAERPEARNLVNIYAALSDQPVDSVMTEVGGQQFGQFKPALADLAVEKLAPISGEMSRLMQDPSEIDRILAGGADRARAIASPILKRTYEIVGMVGA